MTATIAYDKPVKNLIDALSATGHVTHTAYKKKSVTLHHNAGRLSHEGVLSVWKTRPASAHFDVDGKGAVCQYVKVNEYAWATGSSVGNRESISIEMANSSTGGAWPVADVTWKAAARLAGWLFAKVIGARPSTANFFYHSHWASTACAGPYMKSIYNRVLAEAQAAYDAFTKRTIVATSVPTRPVVRKSNTVIAREVWAGKWGTGDARVKKLKKAGYNPAYIQSLVNKGVGKIGVQSDPKRKSTATIAKEVIAGKWGNGPDRVRRLTRAGYDATAVQREVNRQL